MQFKAPTSLDSLLPTACPTAIFGVWHASVWCADLENERICGYQTRHDVETGAEDNTGLNDVRFQCCFGY